LVQSLDYYLSSWNLSSPQLIATTPTSQVIKVKNGSDFSVLKLLTPLGLSDEAAGALALRHFAGNGAVQLLSSAQDAQLLEFVDGPSLVPMVSEGKDDEATMALADVLGKLHGASGKISERLITLERRFQSLLTYDGNSKLLQDGAAVTRELLASPQGEIVLHGDLHHENVLLHPERGWLAIDPKGLRGERTFDAANILFNPLSMPAMVASAPRVERIAKILCERLAWDYKRFLDFAFAYGALSAVWMSETGSPTDLPLEVCRLIRALSRE
jgi:streptomycin 6-kinase